MCHQQQAAAKVKDTWASEKLTCTEVDLYA